MTKPKKDEKRVRDAHVWLTEREYAEIAKLAAQETRSVNGQILYLLKLGLSELRSA